jgi:hypothetical protein
VNRDAAVLAIIAGAIGLALGAALFFSGFEDRGDEPRSSRSTPVAYSMPRDDGSNSVIFDLRQAGGSSLLGVSLQHSTYEAIIGLAAPDNCRVPDKSGRMILSTEGKCDSLPAHGEVIGSGSLASGAPLVILLVEVSQACYDTLEVGDTWPSTDQACALQPES